MEGLKDKKAIVTGGASGIGKSIAIRYAASAAILEAKKVNHPLSQRSKSQHRYPHQQIRQYLDEAQVISWGILSNGNL